MALGMTTKCVKYVLFAFNIIFWLSGSVVLAIGLWLRFSDQTRTIFELEGSNRSFYTGVHIFIAAGALMVVVGFLGCCGAIRQSQCMLGLYFAFLLVIFALEMAAAIWCFKKKEKIIKDLQAFYTNTYTDYLETKQESSLKTLKVFHYALTCCGLTGSAESLLSRTCPVKDGIETVKSCPVAIDTFFKNKLRIIGAVALVAGLIMIFGMVFSMVLCCAIRHNRERV